MPDLSSNSRSILLKLARDSIRGYLERGETLRYETQDPELLLKRGCFVTLKKEGALRGCVGTFQDKTAIYENIIRMAPAAAFQDSRFPPVEKDELKYIQIEISVLGELQKMNSVEDIVLGKHGVLVQYGDKHGTYLPEVATEQGWSREEFLTFCARQKAGLKPDECAKAEVFLYEVEKFKEGKIA